MLSDALHQRRTQRGTRWRRLPAGEQARLVVAHLCKGETYADSGQTRALVIVHDDWSNDVTSRLREPACR